MSGALVLDIEAVSVSLCRRMRYGRDIRGRWLKARFGQLHHLGRGSRPRIFPVEDGSCKPAAKYWTAIISGHVLCCVSLSPFVSGVAASEALPCPCGCGVALNPIRVQVRDGKVTSGRRVGCISKSTITTALLHAF